MSKARRKHPLPALPLGKAGLDLHTADGEYVVTAVVPPFSALPHILVWGSRVFQWREGKCYNECFTYHVLDHMSRSAPVRSGNSQPRTRKPRAGLSLVALLVAVLGLCGCGVTPGGPAVTDSFGLPAGQDVRVRRSTLMPLGAGDVTGYGVFTRWTHRRCPFDGNLCSSKGHFRVRRGRP